MIKFNKINKMHIALFSIVITKSLLNMNYEFWTAAGTWIMAILILATLIYTIRYTNRTWEITNKSQKKIYILKRKSISFKLLSELNLNEKLLENIRRMQNVKGKKSESIIIPFTRRKIKLNKIITIDIINNSFIKGFEYHNYNSFLKSNISFNDSEIIFDAASIYNNIDHVKYLLNVLLYCFYGYDSNSKKIKKSKPYISQSMETIELLKKESVITIKMINDIYKKFKTEIDYDFKNRKYYSSWNDDMVFYL